MSDLNEKTAVVTAADEIDEKSKPNTTGLTITRPSPARQGSGAHIAIMSTIEDIDSTHSLSPPPSARNEKSMDHENPFYNPTSGESKQNININHSSYDLEAGLTPQKTECSGRSGLLMMKSRCDPAWPNRQELKQRKKAAKRERACCSMWAGMSKKNRGVITTVVVLFFLAAAIGVGVGISKRVGGGN